MQHPQRERMNPLDFYEREILSTLFERLDQAFPAFGWKRTRNGWIATNRDFMKGHLDARLGRVVCNQPGGFYVHGGEPTTWAAYVHGGLPRGRAPLPGGRTPGPSVGQTSETET